MKKAAAKAKPEKVIFSVRLDTAEREALEEAAKADECPATSLCAGLFGWLK